MTAHTWRRRLLMPVAGLAAAGMILAGCTSNAPQEEETQADAGGAGDSGDSGDSDGRATTPNAPATATGAPSDR